MKFKILLLWNIVLYGFARGNLHEDEIIIRMLGGSKIAQYLAQNMGYIYKGPVLGFANTYLFVPIDTEVIFHTKRGLELSKHLVNDKRILWIDQPRVLQRQKRDFQIIRDLSEIPLNRSKRLKNEEVAIKRPPVPVYDKTFNDELWTQEWYMQDTRTRSDLPKLDLNVLDVYKEGITGKGIRVLILDDGIEYTHEDLKNNYDKDISWDCNEDDNDPMPHYDSFRKNSHGTRCAGEVAMTANNGKCGVGIAYNAKVGGVKLLDGLVNDRIEGTALGYAHQLVDIYSASWGPNDDGKTVDGPGRLANEAFVRGITSGRQGRGSIYVWASGNGGKNGDNCNCDGYLASPYTISIGSASQRGEFPWYGEECASTMAVTYSSGAYQDQMIATTDLHNQCTVKHTGTSASAPLAAGIIALALEANSNLTWRDVQHLIVWTSEVSPVADNPGWNKNAAGFWFNTRFGFGLMNAYSLVKNAIHWITVPEKSLCIIEPIKISSNRISFNKPVTVIFKSDACKGSNNELQYLEHVEVQITLNYTIRGALDIYLTSPAGTQVQILSKRKLDKSAHGFKNWSFMSVATWGELAQGLWNVTVIDEVGPSSNNGFLDKVNIKLHGSKKLPSYAKTGRRKYDVDYNKLKNSELENEDYYADLLTKLENFNDKNSIEFNYF